MADGSSGSGREKENASWFEDFLKKGQLPTNGQSTRASIDRLPKNEGGSTSNYKGPLSQTEFEEMNRETAKKLARLAESSRRTAQLIEEQRRAHEEPQRTAEKEEREREKQDLARIESILSRPGVRKAVQRFDTQFNNQRGTTLISGIRPDGLVVAVRQQNDGLSYDAWTVDASLPAEQIEAQTIHVVIPSSAVLRSRNGSILFPEPRQESELDDLTQPSKNYVNFYRRTGGFSRGDSYIVNGAYTSPNPHSGGQALYPIPLK